MSVTSKFPSIRPSLNLDFANSERLDPRITFTRASTASYYDGKSVTKAEENLLTQTQTFTTWTQYFCSVTPNNATAPDGTLTAGRLNTTGTGQFIRLATSQATSTTYTFSVYAKAGTSSWLVLRNYPVNNGTNINAWFNLTTGTTGTIQAGYSSAAITDAGNGWWRCSVTGTSLGTITNNLVDITSATADGAGVGTGNLYLWGAQLEQRSSVSSYTPTTTQTITNYVPTLLSSANNVARFEHNPSTGESLGLLIEDQRTNLLTYSVQFDNASWTKTRSSIIANTIVTPEGTLTGDKLFEDATASNTHVIVQGITQSTNITNTLSVYAKAAERSYIGLRITADNTNYIFCGFNLSTGSTGTPENAGNGSGATSTITSVGNGWYRVTLAGIHSSTVANPQGQVFIGNTSTTFASMSYTGDGYSGVYIWGAQLEASSFASSYIPTVASQVTRSADSASMTGTNFSSWYRTDEGTLYSEYSIKGTAESRSFFVGDTTANNYIGTYNFNGTHNVNININATSEANFSSGSIALNSQFRSALAYARNDIALSGNGSIPATDLVANIPVVTGAYIGWTGIGSNTQYLNGTIKRVAYYPKRLSNTELQTITS